ncbi:MAG TPA: fimbria/pilus outer membrane usher protein [Anaeromyxobacteraceae bacterium]|nr:fimbria/pilus outer membrane usher protein [Anaeromyxobacteraceae bacterium]
MRAALIIGALVLAARAGAAELPVPASPPPTLDSPGALSPAIRANLDVRVNGAPRGEVLVVLEGEDAWMAVEELHRLGAQSFEGTRRRIDGAEWVSLGSLRPQLRWDLDDRTFTLSLTVGPALLGRERIDVGYERPAGTVVAEATGGFLNYAAQVDLRGQVAAFGEIGASSGPVLLSSGFAVNPGIGAVRGVTALSWDVLPRLEKVVVGDAVVSAPGVGTSGVVGGVTWQRDFALDPYLVVAPRPSFTAFAATPSTLEVWVNGSLVRQQQVPAGTLDLANLPVVAGAGQVRTVLRDAFGREQAFDLRSSFAPRLLAPGMTDFGYTAGFLRSRMDASSFDYGRPVLLGRHRVGLDEVVTVGGRAEASLDRIMAGPSVTLGTVVGQLDLEVLGSAAGGTPGGAAALGWSWMGRRWNAGMRVRGATATFATAVLDPWADRAVAEVNGYVSVSPVERLGLGIDLAAARWAATGDSGSATLRADVAIGGGLTALASYTHTIGGPAAGPGAMLSLSWALGSQTNAQASAGAGATGATASAGVARSLPPGPGYGYRVEAEAGTLASRGTGLFQVQTGFGRYEAQVDQVGSSTLGAVRAAGALVTAGSRVFATRPVEEAYALVRVGVPGVTTYLENQEVGTTDSQGDILVPALLARYSNRLSIRASDVPMDHEVGAVEHRVAPMRKGAAVVRFDVTPIRAVSGRLRLEGAGVPARGELVLREDGGERRAATDGEGRFFLEGARPGVREALVHWRGGTCSVTLVVPESPGLHDIGEATCSVRPQIAATR